MKSASPPTIHHCLARRGGAPCRWPIQAVPAATPGRQAAMQMSAWEWVLTVS